MAKYFISMTCTVHRMDNSRCCEAKKRHILDKSYENIYLAVEAAKQKDPKANPCEHCIHDKREK